MDTLSLVVPAYNEEGNIASVITGCDAVARECSRLYEIIVVDDGSCDGTARIVGEIASHNDAVRLVSHGANLGVAMALRTGFETARYDFIFYTDGDGQFDIRDIHLILPHCGDFDLIAGYRVRRADPFHRRMNACCYNLLLRSLFGVPFRDVNCAFKLIRRSCFANLDLRGRSAFFLAEILIRAFQSGMRILEVPVRHYPRRHGLQTGDRPRVVVDAVREAFRCFLRDKLDGDRRLKSRPRKRSEADDVYRREFGG